jgi:hypothetical protein
MPVTRERTPRGNPVAPKPWEAEIRVPLVEDMHNNDPIIVQPDAVRSQKRAREDSSEDEYLSEEEVESGGMSSYRHVLKTALLVYGHNTDILWQGFVCQRSL